MSKRDERKQQSRQALLDAALILNTSGRAFSSISLREITRHAGLVPAAFYRHFADMEQLGLELVDQVALHLKGVLHQLGQAYLYQPNAKTKVSLAIFFQAIEHYPEPWIFLVSERWGGSAVLRQAIDREIQFLIDDLANGLARAEIVQQMQLSQDLRILSQMLIHLALEWAMGWIEIRRRCEASQQAQQREQFKSQAFIQMQLLFRGILNWERAPEALVAQTSEAEK
ncbi:TetR family transcriptional regulator [Acinetobacter sp.]|uniref:TetR family transcriptional regulator n=1 Tax=Acinetobacter sp. TaxID=472 RepID=UPI0035B1C797